MVEEWEVETGSGSRYYTEGELGGSPGHRGWVAGYDASVNRSTRLRGTALGSAPRT
jgi:hypothetical protein